MKILVYGINYHPELTGIGKYTGEMVNWFIDNGIEVTVITAPPYYPDWKIGRGYRNWKYKKEYKRETIYRCPLYIPRKPSALKRIVHLLSFAASSLIPLLMQSRGKPDYIICVAPTLFCVPGTVLLKKITGAKSILHIQDYEVDAMLGLGMAKKGVATSIAKKYESWCLRTVDKVSTISNSMMRKAIEKDVNPKNIVFFPNWSEVSRFQNIQTEQVLNLKHNLKLPEGKKIILYSGNIGEKQGLELVVEVAKKMITDEHIFLFVGQGGGKERLEKMVTENSLSNILFRPLQAYDDLPALLSIADCHLVIQKKGAADAVLPSKLTNILAVGGNSVITAEEDTELGQLCHKYPGIAVCVEPESVDALYNGIRQCLDLPVKNLIAQKYANDTLDIQSVLSKFLSDIQD